MAVTAFVFGLHPNGQYGTTAANRIDWVTDTIKISLHTATYVPNQDTHDFFSDVTNEVASAGYTAGGNTLGTKTNTYTAGTNTNSLDAADTTWTGVTFTTRYAVVYKDTGVAATSPLIAYIDFGADQTVSSGNFTIQFHADGVVKIVVS